MSDRHDQTLRPCETCPHPLTCETGAFECSDAVPVAVGNGFGGMTPREVAADLQERAGFIVTAGRGYSMVVDFDKLDALLEQRDRARYLAQNLFQMVDKQAWRDSGGDDGQGHYEGDYHANLLGEEIQSWVK